MTKAALHLALCLLFTGVIPVHAGSTNAAAQDKPLVIIVAGAAGEEEFGKKFEEWSGYWAKAAEKSSARHLVIGLGATNAQPDVERFKQALAAEPKETISELWIVLLGHGTFDGKEAKFNLRGPDFTATELAAWLQPFKRPVAVIDCSSSSAPYMAKLSAQGRVVITSTRSGYEQNYSRFGQYLSEAIADPEADLDKDGQTSLLEAYLMASRRVAEFYSTEGRLATEHGLIDDNGDGLGTAADWFRGIRAVKRAKDGAALDGWRAHQFHLVRSDREQNLTPEARAKRDAMELDVVKLRDQKSKYSEEDYYKQLETLLVGLAKLATQGSPGR